MKKSMCITYIVEGALYVNVTNKCSNRCDFCIRNNGDGAYGSDSLWLEREPSVIEIISSIFSRDLSEFSELVFCGYGEPSYRLEDIKKVCSEVRKRYPEIKIRINTNGQSDLILKKDTAPLFESTFDVVSISLNTPSPNRYNEICHSIYGENAFISILNFAKNVKKYVPDVRFSVVGEFLSQEEISECRRIADECGVRLRVRDYIAPEEV